MRLAGGLIAASLAAFSAAACSSSLGPIDGDGDESDDDSQDAAVDDSPFNSSPTTPNGDPVVGACATAEQSVKLAPANLVVLYDKSGSMGDRMRHFDCGATHIDCRTFTVMSPSSYLEYVCYPTGGESSLTFGGKGIVRKAGVLCPGGSVGGEPAMLCQSPSGCTQTSFDDPAAKWNPIGQATTTFFGDPNSAGISASLTFFPKESGQATLCQPSDYAVPPVPMRPLPETGAFAAAIGMQTPSGNTPTSVALGGAIAYARAIAGARPTEVTAIVVVTDDDPTDCATSAAQPIGVSNALVAGALSDANFPIKTYVIGVGSELANLNALAAAGGTGTATLVSLSNPVQTATDFRNALDRIRTKALPCDLPLPAPPAGQSLDISQVNVVSTVSGNDALLGYDKTCASGSGWHYDDVDHPNRVVLCDGACKAVRSDQNGKLRVVFGCATNGDIR